MTLTSGSVSKNLSGMTAPLVSFDIALYSDNSGSVSKSLYATTVALAFGCLQWRFHLISGSAAYGRLGDLWLGRKKTILVSCLLTSATAFLTSLSPNIWVYAILRFATGLVRSGMSICCMVLATESVGRKWRGQVGQYGFLFFTVGFLSVPAIAYPTRTHWRNLYMIMAAFPLVYSIFLLPFASESPRWLLVRGRSEEALDVLKKFARLNGKSLPSNLRLSSPTPPKKMGEGELEILAINSKCRKAEFLIRQAW